MTMMHCSRRAASMSSPSGAPGQAGGGGVSVVVDGGAKEGHRIPGDRHVVEEPHPVNSMISSPAGLAASRSGFVSVLGLERGIRAHDRSSGLHPTRATPAVLFTLA